MSTGVRATISSASSTSGSVGAPYDVPRATASATAACTSGWAWPSSIGPHEQIRSTYSWPSTSVSHAPRADRMKRGVPPTARNARTGRVHAAGGDGPGAPEQGLGARRCRRSRSVASGLTRPIVAEAPERAGIGDAARSCDGIG